MNRLNFIDVARSYAIILALFSHAMITFGGFSALGDDALSVRVFTRTATPLFVFMFGMMLELVYSRKAREFGTGSIVRRLLLRSAQCYLGYQLTVVAGILGDHLSLAQGARALIFLHDAHFSNILRLYSIAMILAIPLIWLRCRLGPGFLMLMLLAVWGGDYAFGLYSPDNPGRLDALMGVLFGVGSQPTGPSVWHGMTFVLAGMLVASSLEDWKHSGLRRFYLAAALLAGASASIVLVLAYDTSLGAVITGFADFTYRAQNHIGYYACGLLACSVTLVLLSVLVPLHGVLPDWTRLPMSFAQSSLLSYSLGNILLNLMPSQLVFTQAGAAALMSGLFILLVMLIVSRPALERAYQRAFSIDLRCYHRRQHQGSGTV